MLSEIPSDWSTAPLGKLAKRVRRKAEGTPDTIAMITSTGGFVPQSDKYSRFMAGESLANYVALRRGEFAYNKGNSKTYPQGCVYRQDEWGEAAIPSVYISFRLTDNRLDSDFAAQFFAGGGLNDPLKRVITSSARSNGLLNVSKDDFFACELPLPPLPEQKKIAAILASVDQSIQATEAVIEQTRRVKEGLLQDLLTRGIGHTRFKKTEIGEIPESWEVRKLGSVAELITKGASPKWQGFSYQTEGMAFITSKHVQDGYLDLSEVKCLPMEFNSRIRRSQLEKGDLLINIVGASIGRAAIWEAAFSVANVNQAVAVVRMPPKSLRIELVMAQFLSPRGQEYFGLSQVDNARPNVSLTNLRDFPVALPPPSERAAIADRVEALEDQLRANKRLLAALQTTKAGLLQDLLSGAVRVSP